MTLKCKKKKKRQSFWFLKEEELWNKALWNQVMDYIYREEKETRGDIKTERTERLVEKVTFQKF